MKYEIDIELENMPPELYVETINDFIDSEMDVAIDGSDIVIFNNVNGIPEKKISLDDAMKLFFVEKSTVYDDNKYHYDRAIFTAKCLKNAAKKLDDYAKSLDV